MEENMPPDRELIQQAADPAVFETYKGPLLIVGLFVVGHLGRILATGEEFCLRKFIGEMLLAVVAGVIMAAFGLMQGMDLPQMLFWGGLGSLGGVRLIEWVIKIAKKVKEVT